jgi:hypothetical protein
MFSDVAANVIEIVTVCPWATATGPKAKCVSPAADVAVVAAVEPLTLTVRCAVTAELGSI